MVKVEVISDECVCMSLDHQYSEISIVGGWPAGSLLLDNIIYVVHSSTYAKSSGLSQSQD